MAYRDYLGLLLPRKIKNSEVLDIVNTEKGQANGIASLNSSGQVPSSQLPSYVDDIVEYNNQGDFPLIGETGKIYCDVSTGKIYRWSGSDYVEIPPAYSNATTAVAGLMSTADKIKLDNCSTGGGGGSSLLYVADGTSQSVLLGNVTDNIASGLYSIAEGNGTTAFGENSHAEGAYTEAFAHLSHAEGDNTLAYGNASHAEGSATTASGEFAHAEGNLTIAEYMAHAEGYASTASGDYSHAEGTYTEASGMASHAEGQSVSASGLYAHAEGNATTAEGNCSHAEGLQTHAYGNHSHAGGFGTVATEGQTVIGQYNATTETTPGQPTTQEAVFIIGNGSSEESRSDAFAIKQDGTLVFANGTEITPALFAQLKALLS